MIIDRRHGPSRGLGGNGRKASEEPRYPEADATFIGAGRLCRHQQSSEAKGCRKTNAVNICAIGQPLENGLEACNGGGSRLGSIPFHDCPPLVSAALLDFLARESLVAQKNRIYRIRRETPETASIVRERGKTNTVVALGAFFFGRHKAASDYHRQN
jgi:hypothetical protein